MEDKKVKERLNMIFAYFISFVFYELVYQLLVFGVANLFSVKTIYYALFALISSIILTYITRLFKNSIIRRRIMLGIILVCGIFYFASFMFKDIFNTFFSIRLIAIGDQAVGFFGTLIVELIKRLYALIIFVLPYLFTLRYKRNISYSNKFHLRELLILIVSLGLFILFVNVNQSANDLFYKIDNNASNVEKLGVNVSTYLDLKRIIFPVKEEIVVNDIDEKVDEKTIKEYGYNKEDIDFDSLIASESNKSVRDMHEYFKNSNATLKNDYTGLFEGKNVIMFMGESFNEIAVSEKYTPTLYKLSHDGFEFTNFYTPVNLSTIGGEFQNLTGLFANLSMLSNKFRKGTNYYPYGVGTVYKNLGYDVSAYHPNTATFQNRDVYLKSLGFDKYLAKGTGLEKLMNCNQWPQSDYDMVNATIDDIISQDKFMAYYVSVSGHMTWTFGSNDMSRRNKDAVEDLNVSEEAKAYVAANIELDKALELVVNKLRDANKLDDTVIVVVADHYPYSMELDTINELSTYERDLRFEVNHSTLILYNSKVEHQVIDKVSTQLDVLPTLYNLFNIKYDSRLIMGKDIFSNSEGIAYFTDRSWITSKGRYNASIGRFIPNEGVEVDNDYVKMINNEVSSRINLSKLIMENDYYRKVLGGE